MTSSHNKKQSTQHFNQAANEYLAHAELQHLTAKELLKNINTENKLILDIGSGPNLCQEILKPASIISLDLAQNTLGKNSICADMDALPILDNSVDIIIANLSFHWSHDLDLLIKECQRILKPNGELHASICIDGTLNELKQAWRQLDTFEHIHTFPSEKEIKGLFKNYSIKNYTFHTQSLLHYFKQMKKLGVTNTHTLRNKSLTTPNTIKKLESLLLSQHNSLPMIYKVAYVRYQKTP